MCAKTDIVNKMIYTTRLLQACDLYRHGTTNVTILSQPCYYLLTVPNPKLFQSNFKVVTRLLQLLVTILSQPISHGCNNLVICVWVVEEEITCVFNPSVEKGLS